MDLAAKRAARQAQKYSLWQGRANRKEYWLWVGSLFAVSIVLGLVGLKSGNYAFTMLIAMAQARRLRDFGRSGWWAAALLAAQFGMGFAIGALLSPEAGVGVALIITLIPLVVIGAIPGQTHENRYGPAPGQKSLDDVFG